MLCIASVTRSGLRGACQGQWWAVGGAPPPHPLRLGRSRRTLPGGQALWSIAFATVQPYAVTFNVAGARTSAMSASRVFIVVEYS